MGLSIIEELLDIFLDDYPGLPAQNVCDTHSGSFSIWRYNKAMIEMREGVS